MKGHVPVQNTSCTQWVSYTHQVGQSDHAQCRHVLILLSEATRSLYFHIISSNNDVGTTNHVTWIPQQLLPLRPNVEQILAIVARHLRQQHKITIQHSHWFANHLALPHTTTVLVHTTYKIPRYRASDVAIGTCTQYVPGDVACLSKAKVIWCDTTRVSHDKAVRVTCL